MKTQLMLLCGLVLLSMTQAAVRRFKRAAEAELKLEAHPPVVIIGHSKELTLSCKVSNGQSGNYPIYLLLQRTNENGTALVALHMTSSDPSLELEDDRYTVEGEIGTKDGGDTFMKVTVTDPMEEDEGEYVCSYLFLTATTTQTTIAASANVTAQELPEGEVYVPPPPPPSSDDCCEANKEEIEKLKALLAGGAATGGAVQPGDAKCNVGFSAQLKEETGYRLRSNQIIIFNTILTNKGAAYDTSTGQFTAPCTGQYFFSLTLAAQHSSSGTVEGIIRRAEKEQVRSFTYSDLGYDEIKSGSTSVMMTLQEGDIVDVLLEASSEGEYVGKDKTVFNGYFLFP